MINILIFVILFMMTNISSIFSLNVNSQQAESPESPISKNQVAKEDTLYYQVFGMDCPGCHSALEKQIGKLTAVDSSAANWINQELMVIVKQDSVLNEKELFEVIKKSNFTPGERKNK